FEHARRIDPQRFAELRHPFELFEPRTAGTTFDEAGERATWRAVRPGHHTGVRRSPTRSIELSTDAGCEPALPPTREHAADLEHLRGIDWQDSSRDDCVSPAERMRLRDLGPITSAKIAAADLDDLCRRLCC
ncbi:MAG TPA: hypothetical protein VK348_09475, partial [Planctomycetota bacterium]|nr:hypothetical protein [Planctomycetota bacterium]